MKTKTIKKVLIALDYDPSAKKVAETGFSLANALDAEIVMLHVITDPVFYASSEPFTVIGFSGFQETKPFQSDNVDDLKNASEYFLEKLKLHLGDKKIKTLVAEGDYAEQILKTAKDIQADIIIMGSHSRKWLVNIVMGSVTEKVLHHTSIPLFIIPTKKKD